MLRRAGYLQAWSVGGVFQEQGCGESFDGQLNPMQHGDGLRVQVREFWRLAEDFAWAYLRYDLNSHQL